MTTNIQTTFATIPTYTSEQVREALRNKQEIALIDPREEDVFAKGHPLFAANFPISSIETDAYTRIPRLQTLLVIYDNGEGLAEKAAKIFEHIGYSQVHLLSGGLKGWKKSGGIIFEDVNSPSKAFGELVESKRETPMLSPNEVKQLIDSKSDYVILDARRFDEYHTMNIPGSYSVPGAELVLIARELAPNPHTKIIVNCAGRTRSIIGTQSLINAGLPNQIAALRNGTIGWTLDGQTLEHGADRLPPEAEEKNKNKAATDSWNVAAKAGVKKIDFQTLKTFTKDQTRTTYLFDVRTEEEYRKGHLPHFLPRPGGQLVQETDHSAPVRGARIVLADDLTYNVRANMTASWLQQMGWEAYVLSGKNHFNSQEKGLAPLHLPSLPIIPSASYIKADKLAKWLGENNTVVIDFSKNSAFSKTRIPGAWYILRSQIKESIANLPNKKRYVLTSEEGLRAIFAYPEIVTLLKNNVYLLAGGNQAWSIENRPLEGIEVKGNYASTPTDRYKRPYEGTDHNTEAMEKYLQWEYGLVKQLEADSTHGFWVLEATNPSQ
ncbi:3-mercaptopyruvate sulfurtransferase SseA, contains two rhodanese domains [bacterium A37T11]|nr:3-mercaptopyruvate sulfurtransferase SseA, contains two rhodanese domains [bacterium A37T11]